jgi:hypothetical protein
MNTNENVSPRDLPVSPYFGTELWPDGTPIPVAPDGTLISRYFYNNDTNQLISYTTINGYTGYFDTSTNERVIPTLPPYYEITFKDYLEKNKPIRPMEEDIVITEKVLKDWLSPLYEKDMGYEQNDLIDTIKTEFAKHIDLNNVKTTYNNASIQSLILPQDKVSNTPITTIDIVIQNNPALTNLYIVFNFLRSYIDLYHDILDNGLVLCEPVREHFEKTFISLLQAADPARKIYQDYMNIIIENPSTKIFTLTNNINQSRCHSALEAITDKFIQILHAYGINWIPKTRQEAFVKSISLSNDTEVIELLTQLEKDGVNSFFVESANSSIGKKLTANKFPRSNISIGEWDAGSGYSKGALTYLVGPTGDIKIANPELKLFNMYNIIVSPDNKTLNIKYNDTVIVTIGSGPKKLSVNSLLNAIGFPPVRGESTGIDLGLGKITEPLKKAGVISLKTWTDLIQIAATSASKVVPMKGGATFKQAIVISDGLCEVSARMYGLGHVLKNEKDILTYYCFDNNSRILSESELITRLKLKAIIIQYKDTLLKFYIDGWFNQRIDYLKFVLDNTIDPVLYFVCYIYVGIYEKNRIKALTDIDTIATIEVKNLPSTLNDYIESITQSSTTLANLIQQIDKFQEAIGYVNRLRSRATINEYLNAYNTVQQEIVNTFKDSSTLELRVLVATTIASSFMKGPGPDHLFTSLDTIKKLLINNRNINLSINNLQLQQNILSGNANINKEYLTMDYLPRINKVYNELKLTNIDTANNILNICDVELALLELMKLKAVGRINASNMFDKTITYYNYVRRIVSISGFPLREAIKAFSFSGILSSVGKRIVTYIGKGIYSGGKQYKNKTYRNKKNRKHKKYRKITIKRSKK